MALATFFLHIDSYNYFLKHMINLLEMAARNSWMEQLA
jgi:hypothetical protein